eukprot:TRINITY_DN332_c1_g2_i4.p1 TRINITY_DN332_c1_g2~~TRINITY_DN332_c1_g2_i4.p1  ORF type:complete len:307 (-),score=91.61 TRINITY_DN332_c1_g2_i4:125-1045(-)
MDKYRRVNKPKEELPKTEEEIRVTAAGSVSAYVSRAATVFNELSKSYIIIQASGNALTKAVTAAEVIKRRFKGLHQITELKSQEIVDEYEPLEEGLDKVVDTRTLSVIEIKLSKEPLDTSNKGYQAPLDESLVKEYDAEEMSRGRGRGRGGGRGGRGKGKGRGKGASKGKGKGKSTSPSKGKGKGKSSDKGKGKGKGKDKSSSKGKGKSKSKYDDYDDYAPSKGKSKGKGKDKDKSKGKSKGKYDDYSPPKGKGSKGGSKGYDSWDAPKGKGKGKDKGKGKSSGYGYEDSGYGKGSKGKGKSKKGW